MAWFGLLLLALALLLMMSTGWPTYAVLLGVCTLGVLGGAAVGGFDLVLLGTLPSRVVGLLEHDLLQALALYALVGGLLSRLLLADEVYGGLRGLVSRVLPRAAPPLAGLLLGALLAPMNGSVGASLQSLARTAGRQWPSARLAPPRHAALVAVASTLGVVVPPSLVLLLLGDALLRAHTEGLNLARQWALPLAGADVRIVNTQDLMQAVLLPAAALLLGWLLITAWGSRRQAAVATRTGTTRREWMALAIVPTAIALLLTLVASGYVRAVEAAAAAGLLLLVWGAASHRLTRALLWQVLDDAMALTGALFALLIAATTFSLVLRGLGTDRLVGDAMRALQGQPTAAVLAALGVLLACAFVLDAFELIFLIVPIVMPPLLAQVGDAAWVGVLCLLVLQAGFLLPPFGYAVVLARGQLQPRPGLAAMGRALAPYLCWLALVGAAVLVFPQTTQWLRPPPTQAHSSEGANDDVERLMREMSAEPADPSASDPAR